MITPVNTGCRRLQVVDYNLEMAATGQFPVTAVPTSDVRQRVQRYFELSLFAMVVTGFVSLAGTGRLDAFSVLFVLAALGAKAFIFGTSGKAELSVALTSRLTIG